MSKFYIKIGTFNKIISIPFLLALIQLIITIFELFYPEKIKHPFLGFYSESLGQIAIIIIPYLKCFSISAQKDKIKCQCSKINSLHYFILLFLFSSSIISMSFCNVFGHKRENTSTVVMVIYDILSTKVGIEIILVTIIDKFLLKYEYYIHHYISILAFLICSVSIDLLLDNYSSLSDIQYLEIILNIIYIITRVAYLCYIKYMIDKHFHYYWNIKLSSGILELVICIILTIIMAALPKEKWVYFFLSFFGYINKVPKGTIISKYIICFIFQFIFHTLEILTIFYLSPEFTFISRNVAKLIVYLKDGNNNKYICIIFFLLQFFCLMIYLEILELNFLKLNKNTKRNIKLRVNDEQIKEDIKIDIPKNNKFEIGDGYIFENDENENEDENNLKVELKDIQIEDN